MAPLRRSVRLSAPTSDAAHELAQVVLRELAVGPEADVFVAGRELGVGLEPRLEAATLKLLQEPLVAAPKQPAAGGGGNFTGWERPEHPDPKPQSARTTLDWNALGSRLYLACRIGQKRAFGPYFQPLIGPSSQVRHALGTLERAFHGRRIIRQTSTHNP
jgi:hypothetical protein